MRHAAVVILAVLLTPALPAPAQPVALADGSYASLAAYLEGRWKWECPEPRQTMIMRFSRDGTFFYENPTTDVQQGGTYTAVGQQLELLVNRSCRDRGRDCQTREPPVPLAYEVVPRSAILFSAHAERWERIE